MALKPAGYCLRELIAAAIVAVACMGLSLIEPDLCKAADQGHTEHEGERPDPCFLHSEYFAFLEYIFWTADLSDFFLRFG